MNCNIQSHLPSVQYCGARFLLWLHNIDKFSTFANLYFCIKIQFELLNLQFTHCLHSFTHCLWDAHSFVGARGQVRPTGVSAGECQGHQQSLTPLSKPQIPLSKPPTPKPHQTSHPLMYDVFYHRAAKTMQMCQCVSIPSPNVPTAPKQCFWLVLFCYHISTTQVSKYWSFLKTPPMLTVYFGMMCQLYDNLWMFHLLTLTMMYTIQLYVMHSFQGSDD